MQPADLYRWLMSGSRQSACDHFDAHVLASVLSLAVVEGANEGVSPASGMGLAGTALTEFVGENFPHAREVFARLETDESITVPAEEACLRDMLLRCTTSGSALQDRLAVIIARRAQRPNHLWQDLGLRNRRELSWLMGRHFEWLAARNANDMKWKKFLYRMICRDGSFPICTAPTCGECGDFENCFGEENGEGLLALARRAGGPSPIR